MKIYTFKNINDASIKIKNKIVKIVFNLYFLFNSGIINMNMYCKYMLKLGGKK